MSCDRTPPHIAKGKERRKHKCDILAGARPPPIALHPQKQKPFVTGYKISEDSHMPVTFQTTTAHSDGITMKEKHRKRPDLRIPFE
jgi:hypothetical protein